MKYTEYIMKMQGAMSLVLIWRVKAENIQPFNPCWLVNCWKRMR